MRQRNTGFSTLWKELKFGRGRLLGILALLSLTGLVGFSIISALIKGTKFWEAVLTFLQSLMLALVIATTVEIIARLRDQWERQRSQAEFRGLFGIRDRESPVAVALPQFFSAHGSKAAEFYDVKACAHLIAAFSGNDLPAPQILSVEDSEGEMGKADSRYEAFVIIGLLSNKIAVSLQRNVSFPPHFEIDEHRRMFVVIRRGGTRAEYRFDRDDYALVAKVVTKDTGKVVFVCGGITGDGTARAAEFVGVNWRRMRQWKDNDSDDRVEDRPFAAVLRIPKDGSVGFESVSVRQEAQIASAVVDPA